MPTAPGRGVPPVLRRGVGAVVVAAVVVAMIFSTKFVDPTEAARINPAAFDAATFANERFPTVAQRIQEKAVDVTEFAKASGAGGTNRDAAAQKYGQGSNGLFSVPVKTTGTVASLDENYALLTVPGMPAGAKVRLPIGNQVDGTAIRDATDAIKFGDVPGQTDFLTVANELTKVELSKVLQPADLASLKGKRIEVLGAYQTVGPRSSYLIQPVSIKAAP